MRQLSAGYALVRCLVRSGGLALACALVCLCLAAPVYAAGSPVTAKISAGGVPTADCVWHTVVPGDTLGNLGWSDHSTALAIARANAISDPDLIYVGQSLCLPKQRSLTVVAPQCIWHTVLPGDTLSALALQAQSTTSALARANGLSDPNLLIVGQRVCIPVDHADASAPASSGAIGAVSAVSVARTPTPVPAATATPSGVAHTATASASTAASLPAAPNTQVVSGVQQFIQFVLPYARVAHAETGWPVSLIVAQWGVEQGWHAPTYTGYNFGNCGAVPGEPLIAGLNVPGSPAAFAYAPTPADGVRIYVEVAHLSYYAAVAPAAAQHGVDAAAQALGQSPWDAAHYTPHGGTPGTSLLAALHTYNLYWYDTH